MTVWDGVQCLYALPHPMFTPAHVRIYSGPEQANVPWETMGQKHGKSEVWQQITFRHLARK